MADVIERIHAAKRSIEDLKQRIKAARGEKNRYSSITVPDNFFEFTQSYFFFLSMNEC